MRIQVIGSRGTNGHVKPERKSLELLLHDQNSSYNEDGLQNKKFCCIDI